MFTLDLDSFMFELKDGALKHVGSSTNTATAKLYDIESVEVRGFGDDRVKVACEDDSGNEVEIALDADSAESLRASLEELADEGTVFE